MSTNARILVVEDSDQDFELIARELDRAGIECDASQVNSPLQLGESLSARSPDIVLCDHAGAGWDSFAVLSHVRAHAPGVPFVIVSGAMDPRSVARAREMGVDDVVLKHRVSELGVVVRYAIRLGEERRRRIELERRNNELGNQLEAMRARRNATGSVPICCDCKRIRAAGRNWTKLESYLRDTHAIRFNHILCPDCVERYNEDIPEVRLAAAGA